MPMLPIHPMLAPLVQGGAVPGLWLAEVRGAGEWADRFVNEGWESLEALRVVSYSALLESPLGGGNGALAAALSQLERDAIDATEPEATTAGRRVDDLARPTGRPRSDLRQAMAVQGGRRPPLQPASPPGPIGAAKAAAQLAHRAAAAGLDAALRQVLGPQPLGGREGSSASAAQTLAAGWDRAVDFARQQGVSGSGASAAAGALGRAARSTVDAAALPVASDATTRFAEAVDRALHGASPMRSLGGRARARVAGDDPSWPADAARAWERRGAGPVADGESAARGESPAMPAAERLAARGGPQGLTGLRGLAARAAAAGLDDPIETSWQAAVEQAAKSPAQGPRDDTRSPSQRAAPPTTLDDEQLAAQLTRVLRREAVRDGVDIDDVRP